MKKTYYDMIYLAACGINGICPEQAVLGEPDVAELYRTSYTHFMDALVGTALKQAGVSIPKAWDEHISKAIRKEILFDAERAQLLAFMEQKGIWYLTLKGIVLKDYYPSVGMRQMSDNDILYDASFGKEVQSYMEARGYNGSNIGIGHHDSYEKKPIYNFEMHRILYGKAHQEGWMEYYGDVKKRLVLNAGTSYGYHFTDEDFYVYIVTHAYKHYTGSGTGLRTLLDFYAYLKVKEQEMDFAYIEKECETLKCAEFERLNRSLCRKVFSKEAIENKEAIYKALKKEEADLLEFYLTQGVYGTAEQGMKSRVGKFQKKSGSHSKLRYLLSRVFSKDSIYWDCPWAAKHKWLLPFACVWRAFMILFSKERRSRMRCEMKIAGEKMDEKK